MAMDWASGFWEEGLYKTPLMTTGPLYGMKVDGGRTGIAVMACDRFFKKKSSSEGKLS